MANLTLPSPAKINLFLHVVGRRPDGYHLLQTAFQFVDFCDSLTFKLRLDGQIHVHMKVDEVPLEDNLVYRAACLLQQLSGTHYGVDIDLIKVIPMGAGLGGGSSNAATTLLGLNLLWQTGFRKDELVKLSVSLGADVPIFISGHSAFAEGIGDELHPINPPEDWLLLIFPKCQVPTVKIFSDSELTRNTPKITIAKFFEDGGRNDCEPVARKHFPEISHAFNWLEQYASVRMSGTGSCIFAQFNQQAAALQVLNKLPANLDGIVTKGLNVSPLQDALSNLQIPYAQEVPI